MRPGLGATYRLQLGPEMGFAEASGRLDHLVALGVETLYCSPVAEAVPGSAHGYDGTDPTALRVELGGAAGFGALSSACEERELGLCVDLVPNHLATWPGGRWWRRLLAEGPAGELSEVFDVAWTAPGGSGAGKVLLPLLDRPLPEALAAGLVRLGRRRGEAVVLVGGDDLPLAGGPAREGEDVAEVLEAQHYRLVDWHDKTARNYRRFFDIDGLVGVRVEREDVFDLTHGLVVELAARGRISALRVDHVDGLREPAAYLERLRAATGLPVVVEKILTGDEQLRRHWPVAGTTGYEVIDDVGGALVDPEGHAALVAAGRADGDPAVGEATVRARALVVRASFPGEIARLAGALSLEAEALAATLARLPVYRTYLAPGARAPSGVEVTAEDRGVLEAAGGTPERDGAVAALLDPANLPATLAAQQLMGAVMAKGVEDTAWYRLSGPLAFCEVGGDPGRDRRDGPDRLHRRAGERAAGGRAGLVPSSTHDTKRSGDVRARLYALSGLAAGFEAGLGAFRRALRDELGPGGPAGEAPVTRLLAETALAVLPCEGVGDDLAARVAGAVVKGAREAKVHTTWTEPDEAYETGLRALVRVALAGEGELVRRCFGRLVADVARHGAVLSLASVVLRSALPGIPDCYQGDEAWAFSLVDPDNRRPVDWVRLEGLSARVGAGMDAGAARRDWRSGAVKVLVTARCLAARRAAPDAFAPTAGYTPVVAEGRAAGQVVALLRTGEDGGAALAVATRLPGRLRAIGDDLPHGSSFAGTHLALPPGAPGRWRDALTGRDVAVAGRTVALADVLGELPVALLVAAR